MSRLLLALGLAGLTAPSLLLAQFAAHQPPTISGALVDERGAPLAEVDVVLRPYPSDYEVGLDLLGVPDALPEEVDRTRSGADGSYSLSARLAGPYRLEFEPPTPAGQPTPAQPAVVGNLMPLQGQRVAETIEVPNRHMVAVRVLDADDRPVEGALVIAHPTVWVSPRYLRALTRMVREVQAGNFTPPQTQQVFPSYHPSASRTDSEGIARLPMPTEDAQVLVTAPGFVQGKARTASGRTALRLQRDPGIRLRVRGPRGAPAPGVLIRTPDATPPADAAGALGMLGTAGALGTPNTPLGLTDANGEAVVSRAVGSQATWALEGANHASAAVSPPVPDPASPPSGEQILDVRLVAPFRIPGRVVDTGSGLPVDGAAVWVVRHPGRNVYAGPTGVFDLNTTPPQTATRLQVSADGYLPVTTDVPASETSNPDEVRIGLTPAAPIRGVVTDGSARPVPGAKIRATPRGAGAALRYSFNSGSATSAADGSFRVEEIVYGHTYRLIADAPGYARAFLDVPPLEPGQVIEPVHLVLTRGRSVLGKVVDTEGNPVTGAQVELRWPLDQSDFRSPLDTPATAAATDDQGAFTLPATAPGEYEVGVRHTEYSERPVTRVDVPAGESDFEIGDFTLVAGATIDGVVTGAEGKPVAGATVLSRGAYRAGGSPTRTARTDAEGRFRLDGLSSDLADLSVRATGYPLLVRAGVRTNADEPVLIELKPGASVGGRVLDNGGNGVAGILVSLRIERNYRTGGDPRLWGAQDMFPRQMTNAEGRFRFDRLVPGTWSAEAKKGAEGAKLDQIELAPGAEREIELLLQTRDRLTVIVTTDGGEPVAGAQITIQSPGERLPSGYGQTDGSGQSITDIAPGPATVEVSHERLQDASRQVDLDPGDNELRFELQPGLEISGTVRSYDGARLALATVEAVTEYSFDTDFHRTNTVSDQNGTFRLTGLEPGRYNLTARSPGYADGGPDEPIEVGGGGSPDGIEIVLEPGASIVGIVTGLSPADLAQVEVQVRRGPRWRSTKPESDGRFSVDSIAPGTWQVIARKGDPPAWRTVERSVTLEPGATEAYVELPYERGLRLTGQVLDAGEPLIGGSVRAYPVGGGQGQTANIDNLGRFELEGLEPGAYQLTISRPLGGGMEYRSVDLQADLEGLQLDLEPATATLAGVIVDARTGQPIDFAQVTAADAATIAALARAGDTAPLVTSASASFSLNEGRFELKLRANAEQLWVTQTGYEGRQIPINVAPGEHREGLVIELQPVPSTPPNP